MPHGGAGAAAKRAAKYRRSREERQEILAAMRLERPRERSGRLVAHGAGPAFTFEWCARVEG
jgi:hypothetical protein